jgi:hypothetical protein
LANIRSPTKVALLPDGVKHREEHTGVATIPRRALVAELVDAQG